MYGAGAVVAVVVQHLVFAERPDRRVEARLAAVIRADGGECLLLQPPGGAAVDLAGADPALQLRVGVDLRDPQRDPRAVPAVEVVAVVLERLPERARCCRSS